MSYFRPTRTSPPLKPVNLPGQASRPLEISQSSIVSIAELAKLSQDEVEILEAVIQRAGPSATTFLSVFKAYNDVLNERGLDPHEVLYYGKLLKLGTLKGKSWGDKWNMVKEQQGYGGSGHSHNCDKSANNLLNDRPRRVNHFHGNESITSDPKVDDGMPMNPSQRRTTSRLTPRVKIDKKQQNLLPKTLDGIDSLHPGPTRESFTPLTRHTRKGHWEADISDNAEEAPYATPPSYHSSMQEPQLSQESWESSRTLTIPKNAKPQPTRELSSDAARKIVAIARERKGSVLNEEDAWNKIRMQRDEKDADEFHADKIIERCWEVWKQGLQWIITTNQQIGEARDNLIIRLSFQRWQNITRARKETYRRIIELSNERCLRKALFAWKFKLQEAQQAKWRHQMRLKMKIIKEKRELKLQKDAWAKWRQSYRSHLSGQHYIKSLKSRLYYHWKSRLSVVEGLGVIADEFSGDMENKRAEKYWDRWRKASAIQTAARFMARKHNLGIMTNVMNAWKNKAQDHSISEGFHRLLLMKAVIRSWKISQNRIQSMEARAAKHIIRQDGVLLRAVIRVWKAHERGKLLERVKASRLLSKTWGAWKQRLQCHKLNEEIAVTFSLRSNSSTVISSFRSWYQAHITHQNAYYFAVKHHNARLCDAMLLSWRLQLQLKLDLTNMAKEAEIFFAVRCAWKIWCNALNSRMRQRRVEEIERQRVAKVFHGWLLRTRREKQLRLAQQITQNRITERILQHSLTLWTNRVIEIKLRELEVKQRREISMQNFAFKRWKDACVRHAEELSLMESYRFVKREENIRRIFHRWISLARTNRHRRITLQKREDEMKFFMIASIWDRWRDRFKAERLHPIEYSVIIQMQRNIIFRAFGIWHSKTKSLPAIQFYGKHAKMKFFEVWRRAMPRALQAKKAREMHKNAIMREFLDKWVRTHRTKMALKAVARARYLRLPTAAPRLTIATSRKMVPSGSLHSQQITEDVKEDKSIGPNWTPSTRTSARPSPANPLRTKPRLEISPTRSSISARQARESSPAARSKSSFGGQLPTRDNSPTLQSPSSSAGSREEGRSKLWLELHKVQRRSKPPSQNSKVRESP